MKTELVVTEDILRYFAALENEVAFQELMKIMHSRMQGMAEWSCSPIDLTYEQRSWMQGRVQEISEWVGAWVHRREWSELLAKQRDSQSSQDMV